MYKLLLLFPFIFSVYTRKEVVDFTIHNNLEYTVTLYIDNNTTIIKQGSSYKFHKEEGTKIYLYKNNQKSKLILVVDKKLNNKKLKLSDLLKKK